MDVCSASLCKVSRLSVWLPVFLVNGDGHDAMGWKAGGVMSGFTPRLKHQQGERVLGVSPLPTQPEMTFLSLPKKATVAG